MLRLSILSPSRSTEVLLRKLPVIPHNCKRWSLLVLTRYILASTLILPWLEIKVSYGNLKNVMNNWTKSIFKHNNEDIITTLNKSSYQRCSIKKAVLNNFAILTGKHVLESLFNKVAGLKAYNFIKKRRQSRCFSVNIAKFLRTATLKNTCERLLLTESKNFSFLEGYGKSFKSLKLARQYHFKEYLLCRFLHQMYLSAVYLAAISSIFVSSSLYALTNQSAL